MTDHPSLRQIVHDYPFIESEDYDFMQTCIETGCHVFRNGITIQTQNFTYISYTFYKNDINHRDNDKPAYIFIIEDKELALKWLTREWVMNGFVHRTKGPAFIYPYKGKINKDYRICSGKFTKEQFKSIVL